jgi:hypothetical protein
MMNHNDSYTVMFFIMIISGLLTTMNVWVDSISDVRFSINDLYMTLLMTGWMFTFMGLYYKQHNVFLFGIILIIFNFWCIRSQFMVSQHQYLLGMLPHHSMAIHMSKKVLENNNITDKTFIQNIINKQSDEINFIKSNL